MQALENKIKIEKKKPRKSAYCASYYQTCSLKQKDSKYQFFGFNRIYLCRWSQEGTGKVEQMPQ